MKKRLGKAPVRRRVLLEESNKIQEQIDNFFIETKDYLENKFGKSPHYQIKSENMENSDNRLTYLLFKNRLVAGVIERRTEFNNLEYVFFRDLSGL